MTSEIKHIRIVVNGETLEVPVGLTVTDLLAHLAVPVLGVAVERNRRVVRRAEHEACAIEEGDIVEIVQFVGGG